MIFLPLPWETRAMNMILHNFICLGETIHIQYNGSTVYMSLRKRVQKLKFDILNIGSTETTIIMEWIYVAHSQIAQCALQFQYDPSRKYTQHLTISHYSFISSKQGRAFIKCSTICRLGWSLFHHPLLLIWGICPPPLIITCICNLLCFSKFVSNHS